MANLKDEDREDALKMINMLGMKYYSLFAQNKDIDMYTLKKLHGKYLKLERDDRPCIIIIPRRRL